MLQLRQTDTLYKNSDVQVTVPDGSRGRGGVTTYPLQNTCNSNLRTFSVAVSKGILEE